MKLLPRIVVSIILPILVTAASTLYLAIHLLQNSLSEEVEERARATLKQSVARLSLGQTRRTPCASWPAARAWPAPRRSRA